jgi:hypothetical protein
MATIKWATPAAAQTVLSTELNALSSGSRSGVGTESDNATDLYEYADIELALNSDVTCGAGSPYVKVYIVPATDGTNYPNPPSGSGAVPENYFVGTISANASATFRRGILMGVVLPPSKFKVAIEQVLGVAFPATTNTVKLYRYNEASV